MLLLQRFFFGCQPNTHSNFEVQIKISGQVTGNVLCLVLSWYGQLMVSICHSKRELRNATKTTGRRCSIGSWILEFHHVHPLSGPRCHLLRSLRTANPGGLRETVHVFCLGLRGDLWSLDWWSVFGSGLTNLKCFWLNMHLQNGVEMVSCHWIWLHWMRFIQTSQESLAVALLKSPRECLRIMEGVQSPETTPLKPTETCQAMPKPESKLFKRICPLEPWSYCAI